MVPIATFGNAAVSSASAAVLTGKISLDQLLRQALNVLDLPVDWLGLRAVKEMSRTRFYRNGLPQCNHQRASQGVMVEVLVNGQFGYGATHHLSLTSVLSTAQLAYHQAIAAAPYRLYAFDASVRPIVHGEYSTAYDRAFDALSAREISDLLVQSCQVMQVCDRVVQTTAKLMTLEVESWWLSSNGSDGYQRTLQVATDYGATAQAGTITQRRTHNGWAANSHQGGLEQFLRADRWNQLRQVGEEAVALLDADECPTETTTLVLAPDQMLLQIHESVGHPLELDRILGDERNYAGGSFVKPTDFGQLVYGSPLMNITFDPTVPTELASYRFDDTGNLAQREYLIREGRLLRGLGSLESQRRSGLAGVACQRASSWNRPAIDRMANLNLEPGQTSLEQLLGNIERGVYMTANGSWSIDDQRHKFQFGCEYARLIENGRLTKVLRNPNYRGTTLHFWHNLAQVGDAATWQIYGSPSCGKGEPNQLITVGHASPICAFTNMEVFGGAV